MPEKPAPPLAKALIVSHVFGPFDGQVRGYIPQGRDRNAEGHFLPGPVRARPITARLAELTVARCPEPAPPPAVAHAQAEIKKARARDAVWRRDRFLASVQGARVGRNPKAKAA